MTVARETGNYFEWNVAEKIRPYEIPAEQECRDGESDDEWLKRIGYEWEGNMGIPDVHQLRWFGRKEPGGHHAFVATLVESSSWRAIFLPTYDALLRLRALMAPLISQSLLEVHLTQLDEKASKAFRAWHGHHESRACFTCDPEGAKRQREEEEERFRDESKPSKS